MRDHDLDPFGWVGWILHRIATAIANRLPGASSKAAHLAIKATVVVLFVLTITGFWRSISGV